MCCKNKSFKLNKNVDLINITINIYNNNIVKYLNSPSYNLYYYIYIDLFKKRGKLCINYGYLFIKLFFKENFKLISFVKCKIHYFNFYIIFNYVY